MIISSHHLDQVMEVATRIVLLESGKMKYIGPNNRQIAEKIKDYFLLDEGRKVFDS
jgi:ABC-type multidrug transport system ATPase subunit